MSPLLLLPVLILMLAANQQDTDQDGNITTNMTNVTITDERSGNVQCSHDGYPCVFECGVNNQTWPAKQNACTEAKVTEHPGRFIYTMDNVNCSLYFCTNDTILPRMRTLDHGGSDQEDMAKLLYIRDSCKQLFSNNTEIKKAFIQVERHIIHSIMKDSEVTAGQRKNYKIKVLSLNVVNISEAQLAGPEDRIQIEAPQVLPQNESFVPDVWLPVNALRSIPQQRRLVGLVSYMRHGHFQFEEAKITSMAIRIELLGERLHDLDTPVRMDFRVVNTTVDDDFGFQCAYFDESDDESSWQWKTDGCETSRKTDSDLNITCSCSHTTPFAVLLIRQPIPPVHWEILSYISYIGCGLSAFFTALSLVIYVFSRNHKMDYSFSIHVSLSGALFMLNTTFLLSEWGATVKPDWVCMLIAALMHFSLLCCFTWMAIEALHLYLMLIKVFNTHYKHYMLKLSLAGWGIPGVIVTVSLGVKDFKQFYGVTRMTMTSTNETNAICWITDESFFYSLNLPYFALIFIFNSGILMAVASSICKMKQVFRSHSKLGAQGGGKTWRNPERFNESCRSGLTVLGLTTLMGTTWGLAFLGSGYVNYPILYLFCILNSAQGFFIFLWICLSVQKQRRRDKEDRMTSTPAKTLETKSE